ncbi:gfo/Idh/MocA family oxidoreductase [Streptomyces sp. TRM43335]|uniref:Gfo/Idh/MocA family oxidoreductase n=1 Tax=Streptomyces taklimakanensis TaxID=2569853 RepID=A0A6G2BHA0_9ACTN|nr:Gfo/Idh/MocA family oxidoreductase [Streptomyces taklimakanensis]MTE21449.1 gfo/Idh/MocA family oxidoreductase [Streptomyces taklimakanensis]
MPPLRLAVLGCADFARRRMLPAFAACDDIALSAVASRDHARARSLADAYGCRALHGYTAALEDDDVDAVYIPLPAGLHAHWVREALLAGKHVLAEKPLATTRAETADLLDLARTRGLALVENVLFPHHSQHARARELVEAGTIGEPRFFQAAFTVPRRPDTDIRYRADLGGGALWDVGVYPVRAALFALGEDLRVAGAVAVRDTEWDVDTGGAALLHTPSGVSAQLAFGLDDAYRSVYTYAGSRGRLTVEPAFTPPADHIPSLRLERGGEITEVRLAAEDQVARAVAAFVAAVRGGVAPDVAVLRQAALLEAIATRAAVAARP